MSFPEKTATADSAISLWKGSSPSDARLLALLGGGSGPAAAIALPVEPTARRVAQMPRIYVRTHLLLVLSAALILGFLGGCAWERH